MRLGFIGTGTITAALVTGLCRAGPPPESILVSPRNAERAAALAAAFCEVRVAEDNQAVVDGSDWVVLAVTPRLAREVVGALRFRAEQRILSLMAVLTLSEVAALTAPATKVCRAVPLPPVARGVGPIALCPPDPEVEALLDRVGSVVAVDDEARLSDLAAVTALMAPFYALLARTQAWLTGRGSDGEVASRYVAALFHGLSLDAAEAGARDLETLVAESQTPGGLNEQALARLRKAGWYDEIDRVLDTILARLEQSAAKAPAGGPEG